MKNKLITNPNEIKIIFLDFDGVLTDNSVYTDTKGNEFIQSSKSDSVYINLFKKTKIKLVVVSSERKKNVEMRCKKLKIENFIGINNKKEFILKYLKKRIDISNCIYVGNDLNDYNAMQCFKYRICPFDSNPLIKKISNIHLKSNGGKNVMQEIFEDILKLDPLKFI